MKRKLPTTKKTVIHIWKEGPGLILMKLPFMKDELRLEDDTAKAMLDDLTQIFIPTSKREEVRELMSSYEEA